MMSMDQKGFMSRVDTALTNLIWGGLENDSAASKMVSTQEQISFSSPKAANTRGNRKLSIFLYSITPEAVAANTKGSFALHYLVTPFTGNDKNDHALLEKIIQMLLAKPLIDSPDLESNVELAVKIDSLSLDELSRLWTALGVPFRLSVSLTVSSAEPPHGSQTQITSVVTASETPLFDTKHVTELYQAVLKTFTAQSNGWMNRNMVIKQWVLQDFKKNSGMTVDETQNMLSSLGDKLEHGESTAQFIKPLNQLAGYYQYQLDELKGMQKVTRKQTENIETITMWIKDVNALVEMLTR